MRYCTDTKRLARPLKFVDAAAVVESWLGLPTVQVLYPGEQHWRLFRDICAPVRIAGPQLTDAAIAAIAMEYSAVVHTNDRDFARFPGVRCHYPLQT
jgi:predicted nucleic acid-binding protein